MYYRDPGKENESGLPREYKEGLVDATTSEVTYTSEEVMFMLAVDRYKRANGRKFPSLCEYLAVLKSLGYRKVEESTALPEFIRFKGGFQSNRVVRSG